MGQRSAVLALPAAVRTWLDQALLAGNFAHYQALQETLRAQGYEISKSALHRYGQPLQRRLAAIKASTEAARLLTEGAPDDQGKLSEAVIALVQTELFDTLVNLQDAAADDTDPEARVRLLGAAARNIADVSRASVHLKRYQADWSEKARAAAVQVQGIGERAQIPPAVLAEITERIYGLATP